MRARSTLTVIATRTAVMVAFAAAVAILPQLPLRDPPYPRVRTMPKLEIPKDDSFFVAAAGDELSQMVLYHDLGASISHARKADILVLGDSRAQMGLREDVIVSAANELGLRVFTLACGHAEKLTFPLEVILKHDLRPKIVVAVGGEHIWEEGLSGPATRTMAQTRWEAWKEWTERRAAWSAQVVLHRYVPKIDLFDQPLIAGVVLYRSPRTGWWRPAKQPRGRFPVDMSDTDNGTYEALLPVAQRFKKALDERGTLLVMSIVPYGDTRSRYIPYLSRELGVPSVVPPFDDMFTADASHLEPESAKRYSRRFWNEFIGLPEVQRRLSLPTRVSTPDARPAP